MRSGSPLIIVMQLLTCNSYFTKFNTKDFLFLNNTPGIAGAVLQTALPFIN